MFHFHDNIMYIPTPGISGVRVRENSQILENEGKVVLGVHIYLFVMGAMFIQCV